MRSTYISTDNGLIPLADNDEQSDSSIIGHRQLGNCRFSTYRAERVSLTSSLWSGGDWHWRLTAPSGTVLADCGGYSREVECLAVIEALRANAHKACLPLNH